jgi:excisionase family DNA binding protein
MALAKEKAASSLAANNSEFLRGVGWVRKPTLAQHLAISVRSIDNLIARRAIPFARFGRSVRFRIADVDRALEKFVRKEATR